MLYKEAVKATVLELINILQKKKYLQGFYLVGGTALSLYLGHRKSVDIDLFSNFDFDSSQMLENIQHDFDYQLLFAASNTLKGNIGKVNVDIIAHRYDYVKSPDFIEEIYLLSIADIIAMKLNAISTSGQRSKDFIDIYYLLEKSNIGNMLDMYKSKYKKINEAIILKSLIYFDEVDLSDWPVLIVDPDLKWKDVKSKIEKEVTKYLKKTIY